MKGLYAWVGFKAIALPFEPNERQSGTSSFGASRLTRLALSGLASFSTIPLQFWIASGILISGLAVTYGIYVIKFDNGVLQTVTNVNDLLIYYPCNCNGEINGTIYQSGFISTDSTLADATCLFPNITEVLSQYV